jgi:hypothetical protein
MASADSDRPNRRPAFPGTSQPDVMIFKNIFAKKSAKMAFFTQNKAKLCSNLIITLIFEKKRQFVRRKLSKIAENWDYNIDPWETRCVLEEMVQNITKSIFGQN